MRVPRFPMLVGLALVLVVGLPHFSRAEVDSTKLFREAMKAIDSGRNVLAKERLKEILKGDPSDYRALVVLGQLASEELAGGDRGLHKLNAANLLLRAAALQPLRAEAFLALAQLYYDAGYVDKGDQYAKMALATNPSFYEAFCLLGQRYEDSGNFSEAMKLYTIGLKYHPLDTYFLTRRYMAASRGGLTPDRFVNVPSGKDEKSGKKDNWTFFVHRYPDYYLLTQYSRQAQDVARAAEHYHLPIFRFDSCFSSAPPRRPKDLYEAFLKASIDDPAQYKPLRAELDRIRKSALRVMATKRGDKAKAQALYDWLKKRLLRTYDSKRGMLAETLFKKKKYVSLNATILYTLIAREAGLKVDGFMQPGHFFARLDDGLRKIPVELSADTRLGLPKDQGFDVSWWDQFRLVTNITRGDSAFSGRGYRMLGPTDPVRLTAYQFIDLCDYNLKRIEREFKVETDEARSLREEVIRNKRKLADKLRAIRDRYNREPDQMESRLRRTREKFEEEIRKQELEIGIIQQRLARAKAKYLKREGLELIRKAMAMAPDVDEFDKREEEALLLIAEVDIGKARTSIMDRKRRKFELFRQLSEKQLNKELEKRLNKGGSEALSRIEEEISRIEAEIAAMESEEQRSWENEKTAWMNAITTLEKAVTQLPCSQSLKRNLEAVCWTTVRLAERNKDKITMDQVIRIGVSRLPDSDFARHYRERESASL